MTTRIDRFSRGEVLRAGRLNEMVDAINVGLARPEDVTESVSTSGNPDATSTTWTVISVTTTEEEVEGEGCTVTVTRITGFTARDAAGNEMVFTGFGSF